jgi:hypothetical protein
MERKEEKNTNLLAVVEKMKEILERMEVIEEKKG